MPEVATVLFLLLVSTGGYLILRRHPRTRAPQSAHERVLHLRQRLSWLEERIERGRQEAWDAATLEPLVRERDVVQADLHRTTAQT